MNHLILIVNHLILIVNHLILIVNHLILIVNHFILIVNHLIFIVLTFLLAGLEVRSLPLCATVSIYAFNHHRVSPEFTGSRDCVPMVFIAESPPAQSQ